jgi:TonB-dependent receptor
MTRVSRLAVFLAVLVGCLWPMGITAQFQKVTVGQKGAIAGTVTDSSGGVLKGAQISLAPVSLSVVSDLQGQFFINDLDPGSYTVTIAYVGFKPFTKTVDVAANQRANVDAKLELESVNLQVLVTAERPSAEAASVNQERAADNIVQILPAEVIRSMPNANMADALGRLPSVTLERDEGEGKYVQVRGTAPQLTNTTINGMNVPSPEKGVRQIKFDAIPADIVEAVEINKTLQANMDGDGIGGSINLVTKTAGERPTMTFSEVGGYTPIVNGRGLTEAAGTIGQRFGAQKRLGLLIGGSYDWNGRGIDDIEPVSDVATFANGATALWKDSQDIREYRYYRSRWGITGSADYKVGADSNIYIRGLYSDFKNYGDRWVYSLTDNTPVFNSNVPSQFPNAPTLFGSNGCGFDDNTGLESCGSPATFNTQSRRPDYGIGSIVMGGKHVLTTTWFSWDFSVGRSHETDRGYGTANFGSSLSTSSCQFVPSLTTNNFEPQWSPACFTEAYDPANLSLSNIRSQLGQSAQVNLQAAGSIAKRYHIGSHLSTIEIGGKFRNAHKYDDTYIDRLTPNVPVPLTTFPSVLTNHNYYMNAYQLGPNPGYQDVLAFANTTPIFAIDSTRGNDPGNYDLTEKVGAGYLMDTLDVSSRIRIVAGVRFENTDLRTLTFDTTTGTLSDRASGSYLKTLPSASLRYGLTSNDDIRLVYGRGLSRPQYQDLAQAVTFTNVGSPGSLKNTATLGNPNLRAETADNFDILFEHYLNSFGMVSAGVFYKRITDPIVTTQVVLTNFQPSPVAPVGTYTTTEPINAGNAAIGGVEAAYLEHLTFLPGKLAGLGISANYGYTASRISGLPGRSDHPRLLRNSPNTWNISPTYDRGRFSIRVGLSYNQANINSYNYQDGTDGSTPTPGGLRGPFGDVYFYSHIQLDAQGSVRMSHGLEFIAYGLDLNNEVFGFYQGSTQYMIQREFYQPTVAAGVRWSPLREK